MKKRLIWVLSLIMISSLFWMCSEETQRTSISGVAVKGLIVNADVSVYAYENKGVRGELLATTITDHNGSFKVTIEYTGVVQIIVTGGTYNDEATGSEVSVGSFELRNIFIADGDMNIGVTALTTIAASYVDEHAEEGLATAIANANRVVAEAFGLSGIDISSIIPADLSTPESAMANENQKKYGSVLAGLSELIRLNGLVPEDVLVLIGNLSDDLSDGVLDGMDNGEVIEFVLTITPEEAMDGLQNAIDSFINGPRNKLPDFVPVTIP